MTRHPNRESGVRYQARAAAVEMPGRDRRWNPQAIDAALRPEFARCRRHARRSDRSNRAPRHYGPASVNHLLLLLLLLLLRRPGGAVDDRVWHGLRQRTHDLGGAQLTIPRRRTRGQHPGVLRATT